MKRLRCTLTALLLAAASCAFTALADAQALDTSLITGDQMFTDIKRDFAPCPTVGVIHALMAEHGIRQHDRE